MRTELENTSGVERFFGYIPPHGETLADGATVTVDGDLRTVLAGGRNRYSRSRELDALDEDIDNGDVVVTEVADPSSSSSSA